MMFRQNKLYACGDEGGLVAGLIRFDDHKQPSWTPGTRTITWVNPGGRQRAYEIARVVADDADRFAFEDPLGRRFELRELTPEYYNDHVRRAEAPRLSSAADLLAAFEASLA